MPNPLRLFAAFTLACVTAPVSADFLTVEAGVSRARVTTDAMPLNLPLHPNISEVPAFTRDLTLVSARVSFRALLVPVTATVFVSDAEEFVHRYGAQGLAAVEFPVTHSLRAAGARVAWAPSLPLGNGWELDGALGVQHVSLRIALGEFDAAGRTQSRTGPYGGVGVTWWPLPVLGLRAGVDVAEDYEAFGIGVRIGF